MFCLLNFININIITTYYHSFQHQLSKSCSFRQKVSTRFMFRICAAHAYIEQSNSAAVYLTSRELATRSSRWSSCQEAVSKVPRQLLGRFILSLERFSVQMEKWIGSLLLIILYIFIYIKYVIYIYIYIYLVPDKFICSYRCAYVNREYSPGSPCPAHPPPLRRPLWNFPRVVGRQAGDCYTRSAFRRSGNALHMHQTCRSLHFDVSDWQILELKRAHVEACIMRANL